VSISIECAGFFRFKYAAIVPKNMGKNVNTISRGGLGICKPDHIDYQSKSSVKALIRDIKHIQNIYKM
jgi:hypothetical protein